MSGDSLDVNDHARRGGRFTEDDAEVIPLPAAAGKNPQPSPATVSNRLERRWSWLSERPVDWFRETPPARRYLLNWEGRGLMPLGEVAMLAAGGGMGKSWAECMLALAVATGKPWLDTFEVGEPGHVLLALAEEEDEELWRRLHLAAKLMKLTPEEEELARGRLKAIGLKGEHVALTYSSDELKMLGVVPDPSSADAVDTPFARELRQRLRDDGVDWKLLIMEPVSRFGGPDVEMDAAGATRFVQCLERFLEVPGRPTVMVAHHTNKSSRQASTSDSSAARGSSGLSDGVRWQANLERVPLTDEKDEKRSVPDVTVLRIVKQNYAKDPGREFEFKRSATFGGALVPSDDSGDQHARGDGKVSSGKRRNGGEDERRPRFEE